MARTQKVNAQVAATLPHQPVSSTAKRAAKAEPIQVAAPAVAEVGPPVIAGLAKYIALNRKIAGLTALKKDESERLKPLMFQAHRDEVARLKLSDPKKLVKTLQAVEGTGTAGLQLREKASAAIPDDLVIAFTRAKLPLRHVPSKSIINPKYAGSPDKTDDISQIDRTIAALTKLIAENPGLGIPTDLFAETEPLSYADEGTLLKALKLLDKHAKVILPLVADVVVTKGMIGDAEYDKLMNPKTEKKADAKAVELIAAKGDNDMEEFPARASKKLPRLRVVK